MTERAATTYHVPLLLKEQSVITIGRDAACTIVLPSLLVSRQHARLYQQTMGVLRLEDSGSTHGTFVNGRRIHRPQELADGDHIQIGPYAWRCDGDTLTSCTTGKGLQVDVLALTRTVDQGKHCLLDTLSLVAQPGEFVIVAGGSGAGKTTFLQALAGIDPAQSGLVAFNGIDYYQHRPMFAGQIGVMSQTNTLPLALPLERALYFAARLRMANDVHDDEIMTRIAAVLASLDMLVRRHQVVRTLSVGELRRANLAAELLVAPPLLLLDEPTAGLDPHVRQKIIQLLVDLAHGGQTVILITHEPDEMPDSDQLAFIGQGGHLCYYGPPAQAPAYFAVPSLPAVYAHLDDQARATAEQQRFNQSPYFLQFIHWRQQPRQSWPVHSARSSWQTNLQQSLLLMRRYGAIIRQDRVNSAILLLQAPVIAVILALVSNRGVFHTLDGPFEAQKVLFLMTIAGIWFGVNNALREIAKERAIMRRERALGIHVAPYLFAKFVPLSLLCIGQILALELIITAKTGLPPPQAGLFFTPGSEIFIGLLLAALASVALGLCVSAFVGSSDKAISAAPLILLPQIIFAGAIFLTRGPALIPADLTISHWTMQAVGTASDLNHLYYVQLVKIYPFYRQYPDLDPVLLGGPIPPYAAEDYDSAPTLRQYHPDITNKVWSDAIPTRRAKLLLAWGVLGGMTLGFLGIAYLRLRAP